MPEQSFDIVAGQSLVSRNIGFPAFGLVVENITNQWYYEPLRRRYIPPYQSGASVPLIGSGVANLLCQAPGTATQATPIPGEYATASYTDGSVVAGSGVNVGSQLSIPLPVARLYPQDRFIAGSDVVAGIRHVMNSADGLANLGQLVSGLGTPANVYIEYVRIAITRAAAATGAGQSLAWIQKPGSPPTVAFRVELSYNNTIGAQESGAVYGLTLFPGESLDIECQDFNTGPAGSVIVNIDYRLWSYTV